MQHFIVGRAIFYLWEGGKIEGVLGDLGLEMGENGIISPTKI